MLLGTRRDLTKAQLQDPPESKHVDFVRACQELLLSSIVERVTGRDGPITFQVGGLVYEYLSRNHPPDNKLVLEVREKIRRWP